MVQLLCFIIAFDVIKMKNEEHLLNFQNIKKEGGYFNQEQYQFTRVKYYFGNKVDPFSSNYEQLHQLLSTTFKHARRRENFFTNIDRHPDFMLKCVYSGKILSDQSGNMLAKANQEHSFPQSFQRGSKSGTGRDMHAIFAVDAHINGSRGNTPFGNKGKLLEQNQVGRQYLFQGKKFFQPKLNKGTIARASLYILTCYKGCANPKYLPKESVQWMIEASQEEVSLWEKHRNQQLYRLQGNRNPFIDYPELAKNIDFQKAWQAI